MASATFTATFTTPGTFTWVAPAGVSSVEVQCWAGGGGGGAGEVASNGPGGGGGGGEYAAEPANTVVAGDSYTVTVGSGGAGGTGDGGAGVNGGNSSFSGTSATTVTANGGVAGEANTNGSGGTGSSNTTHNNGGAGGLYSSIANGGGGGGGSGGTASAGNAGSNDSGNTGGSGASAVTGGGPGGAGGNGGSSPTSGSSPASGPGGGGGGGGSGTGGTEGSGGNGNNGQVIITWTMASPAVIAKNTSGGTYQWTAPAGVTKVDAAAVGAGGAASRRISSSVGGVGGGGGEYAEEPSFAVTPGTSYPFAVGAAGAGGATATAGGATSFSTYDGLIASLSPLYWWKLNESSGNPVNYGSGSSVTVSGTSGITYSQTGIPGSPDTSYAFSSSGDVTFSGDPEESLSTSGTYEAWVNREGNSPTGSPAGLIDAYGSDVGAGLDLTDTSGSWYPTFTVGNGSSATTITSSASVASSGWYHVVGVFTMGGSMLLYLNGVQVASGTAPSGTISSGNNANLAVDFATGTHFLTGNLAHVAVYGSVLSSTQVAANYASGSVADFVNAHGGSAGTTSTAGAGGTGSSNTIHENGGAGFKPSSGASGGGGGGSGGSASAGNAATTSTGASAVTGGGPGGNGAASGAGSAPASGPGGGGGGAGDSASTNNGGNGFDGQITLTWSSSSPDMPMIQPGQTWLGHYKPFMPRPRPPVPPSGPFSGNLPNYSDVPSLQPGPAWLRHFKPGVRRPPPQVPDSGTYLSSITGTGSMALPPLAESGTGKAGTIEGSGGLKLPKPAIVAPAKEDFNATGSLALSKPSLAGIGKAQPAFPPGPLQLMFELLINGSWVDITGYVYQRNDIVIGRGRPDEGSQGTSNPAQMTLTLNNRDGRFSSANPLGAYYPYLTRNVQIRASAPLTMPPPFDLGYRFWGEVSEWPPSWDPTGTDVYVQVTASGIFRRLTQSAALRSPMYRYFTSLGTAPLAYWPAEDGANASYLASGVTGGQVARWTGGPPSLSSDSSFPGSAALPTFGGATFSGLTGIAGALPVANFATFSSGGTYTWTAPAGVTEVLVTAVGAGGGGGDYNGTQGGGGGGGGEYASDSIAVVPGTTYNVVVGSGGFSESDGGDSTFNGSSVVAHGGTGGDNAGNGGTGGTGSSNATHFDGGAGASGSGGPGGSGSSTQNSQVFTSSGTWSSDSNTETPITVYLWGAGGGGAGGGSGQGGGGGGGGGYSQASVSITPGNSYSVSVGSGGSAGSAGNAGTDGGASQFNGAHTANGGHHGDADGTGGTGGTGNYSDGGSGGTNPSNLNGGGGGGCAAAGGNGSNGGSGSAGGGGGGGAGGAGGTGGGNGGGGATFKSGPGDSGSPTGGGGGGGYNNGGSNGTGGGGGSHGRVEVYWYESSGAPAAAVGGGGGSSGGSASAGNDGATEMGGAAVAGGGPGGGQLAGSTFNAAPSSTPGGGGGGYDSLGGPASGADGLVVITYAAGGTGSGVSANVMRFLLQVPSGGDVGGSVVSRMYTTGTVAYCDVIYDTVTPLTLTSSPSTMTNTNPGPINVTVTGGTVSEIDVEGSNTGLTTGTFEIPAGDTITVTYSSAPTVSTVAVPGTSGYLKMTGYSAAGASLFSSGDVAFAADGALLEVSAEMVQSSSNINWNLTALAAGATSVVTSASGTYIGATVGDVWEWVGNPQGTLTSTAFGHVLIFETWYALTDDAAPLAGYAGETAAARITRLCDELGVSATIIDVGASDTTALMGPQAIDKLVNLLQACEDVDRGLIFEPRGSFGVAYRTRASLYSQSPAVTFNYTAAQLAQPLQPTLDDQLTRNDVTVSRQGGSSYEAIQSTGAMSISDPPDGVGQYTYSLSAYCYDDGQLPDLASWILWIGTQSQLRYPQVSIDLSRSEVTILFNDIVSADIGDYEVIQNPPPWLPPGEIDQLLFGYTETLNAFKWVITANMVPEAPYDVGVADVVGASDATRCDSNGSALHNGIGTADTSFSVDTPSPNQRWVDSTGYPSEFPLDIVIDGEVMTVTAISGTSTPQTFTVTRGVNGITTTHNAGAMVSVYQPAIVAL